MQELKKEKLLLLLERKRLLNNGIGLLKGGKEVQWSIASRITIGWFTLPIIAAIISIILLFILQNIFNLTVSF